MAALLIIQAAVSPDPAHRARYRQYQEAVRPLIESHGGQLRATGLILDVLEGEHDGRRLIVFEFPSMDALRAFWNSSEYAAIKPLRSGASRCDVWAVPAESSGWRG
jgi:uncharacterized protein (DUF1330 family)